MRTAGVHLQWSTQRRRPGCRSGRIHRSSSRGAFRRSVRAFAMAGLPGWIRDQALRPFVTKTFEEAMVDPLNRVCRAVGAKSVASADELVRRAPLMLVASAQPFEYPHPDWADHVQMIGPCEFEPLDPDGNEWIDAIELPIVLVTTSSERQSDTALPAAVMAAMRDEPRHVVATFPCGIPDGLTIPDNATARRFIPHGAVLDRAVCAVTHGGMGVTQRPLRAGCRCVSFPSGVTSSKWRGGWRSRTVGLACRAGNSAHLGSSRRSARPCRWVTVPDG